MIPRTRALIEWKLKCIRLMFQMYSIGREHPKTKYEEALRSSEVKMKIEKLDEIVDTSSVNVQKLINIMVSAGTLSLFRKTFKAKRKNPRQINKKWYDKDCQKRSISQNCIQ